MVHDLHIQSSVNTLDSLLQRSSNKQISGSVAEAVMSSHQLYYQKLLIAAAFLKPYRSYSYRSDISVLLSYGVCVCLCVVCWDQFEKEVLHIISNKVIKKYTNQHFVTVIH